LTRALQMKNFFSSTLLLAAAAILHSMRIISLSFLLGNHDFGGVSTILLMMTLFVEFGALGISQLVYNQPLFEPGRVTRQGRRIGLFFATAASLLLCTALIAATAIAAISMFQFWAVFLTLFCAAMNMMTLACCRASQSNFTHPLGFFIKAVIVVIDIVILGFFTPPIEKMVFWGEVAALPVLLFYAWRVGVLKLRLGIVREIPRLLLSHARLGILSISSAASGMIFFNQERIFGVSALSLEQLGLMTKLLLPKMIAAQGAFLLGVHFHRMIVRFTPAERSALLVRVKRLEWIGLPLIALALAAGGFLAVPLNHYVYDIDISFITGISAALLALVFFFNPYSIMLQATNHFSALVVANVAAVACFAAAVMLWDPTTSQTIILSAVSAALWAIIVRVIALRNLAAAA
jgi:hypothetical protein